MSTFTITYVDRSTLIIQPGTGFEKDKWQVTGRKPNGFGSGTNTTTTPEGVFSYVPSPMEQPFVDYLHELIHASGADTLAAAIGELAMGEHAAVRAHVEKVAHLCDAAVLARATLRAFADLIGAVAEVELSA